MSIVKPDSRKVRNKVYVADNFDQDATAGHVIGQILDGGLKRGGSDKEGVISIDNDALRIQPLLQHGWGRAGISYGPFERRGGLAFGIYLLNGHNTAQTGHLGQTLPQRFKRWVVGSHTESPLRNVFKMALRGNKRRQWKQMRRWVRTNRRYRHEQVEELDENLAVGWFSTGVPETPVEDGNAFVIHATGPENGELWANVGRHPLRVLRGLQNIPLYLVVILREQGAAYYAASLPGAKQLGAFPKLRPLAIDPFNRDKELYAALWQSVMGQIGFWVDTRVYSTRVAQLSDYDKWFGTAQAADRLKGEGSLDQSPAEAGGQWRVVKGDLFRSDGGVGSEELESTAVLNMSSSPGLLHVLVEGSENGSAGLIWRWRNEANYWQILVSGSNCRLVSCIDGVKSEAAIDTDHQILKDECHSLQLVDNEDAFSVYLDGQLLFGKWFESELLKGETGAGICLLGGTGSPKLHSFEAHTAELQMPDSLDFESPWTPKAAKAPRIRDEFLGMEGELSARQETESGPQWKRILGTGRFIQSGQGGIQVEATAETPNPDRTAYTIPWTEPDFADVRVCITPPGQKRNTGQRGRGGFIFWQDPDNYLIVNTWLDDYYEGASLSSFFYINGYEDLYDAVWTNVGGRITWGRPYNLRVTFDGLHYIIHLNDEPVLYRSLTDVYSNCRPLSITQVGLVANWEWGHDTGTRFDNFMAFGREI